MKKKIRSLYRNVDWKFVSLINSLVLIICMLPIVILLEKPTNVAGELKYVFRNNLNTILAIMLGQSENNVFFRGLIVSTGFCALLFLVINILFYSLVTIPILILKKFHPKTQKKIAFSVLLVFVIIHFIAAVFVILQSSQKIELWNYIYIFYQLEFQWVYLLLFLGYLSYLFTLGVYITLCFLKKIKK